MKADILASFLLTLLQQVTANHHLNNAWQSFSSDRVVPIRILALDFDGTATTLESKDLREFIYEANLKYKHAGEATKEAIKKKWDELQKIELYNKIRGIVVDTLEILKNSNEGVITPEKISLLRETLAKMDNTFHDFLAKKEVKNYFLTGLTVQGINEVASKMQLSPGLIETLKRFPNNPANVISAGPSKIFDESVFREYDAPKNLIIHAGEIVYENGISTGKIAGQLTSFDKEKLMGELIKHHQNVNGYSVYVGNDFVDILAMLKADIGIVINYTPPFIRFVHAFGIATPPLGEWRRTGACSNKEYLIYTAQSWYEIEELIFGNT